MPPLNIQELLGQNPKSAIGRSTEGTKRFMVRCVNPKGYLRVMEPNGFQGASSPSKERRISANGDLPGPSESPGHQMNACFTTTSRDFAPGEKSRVFLRRSFYEFTKDQDPPPPGAYNPKLTLPKNSRDFSKKSPRGQKQEEMDLPLSPAPVFASEMSNSGPLLALGEPRADLSLISHRERHLKAMSDTWRSFTGWTPCEQEAVENRNPAWDFHSAVGRPKSAVETYFLPGRYGDKQGYLPLTNKPTVKQGRLFGYKTHRSMKGPDVYIEDLSLSGIVPLVNPTNSQALWQRSKSARTGDLPGVTAPPHKDEDADEIYARQMAYDARKSLAYVLPDTDLAPHWGVGIAREKHNFGHRLFNCDRALRGACGLSHEVSIEHEKLPVDRTAECASVRPKVSCPSFDTEMGRTKTKRWSKTPRLKQDCKRLCPRFERQSTGYGQRPYFKPALAPEAQLLVDKRRARSYEKFSGWDEALRRMKGSSECNSPIASPALNV